MPKKKALIAGIVLCLLQVAAWGQTAPPTPVAQKNGSDPSNVLIKIHITPDMTLDKVLDQIKSADPYFNSVIQRDGVASDYPILPDMKTDNVDIDQFMKFLQAAYPGISVNPIVGNAGTLYLIKISKDQPQQPGFWAGGVRPGDAARAQPVMDPDAPLVTVWPLGTAIEKLTNEKRGDYTQKKAMDDILSLVEAAVKESPDKTNCNIQVHEATETLVFRGSANQILLINHILQTFEPTQDEQAKAMRQKDNAIEHLQDVQMMSEAEWKSRLEREQEQIRADDDRKLSELRAQLDEAHKQLEAKPKN